MEIKYCPNCGSSLNGNARCEICNKKITINLKTKPKMKKYINF